MKRRIEMEINLKDLESSAITERAMTEEERDCFYQRNIEKFKREFDYMGQEFQFAPGNVDLIEVLEFKVKPQYEITVKAIQNYFAFLGMRALKKIRGELCGELQTGEMKLKCELSIYGENGYTTSDLAEFIYGVLYDLPSADGFKISTNYYGPSVAPWFEINSREGNEEFCDEIAEIGKKENFTYKIHEFLYNHGEGTIRKFENGEWVDLEDEYSSDILDKDFGTEWHSWNLDLDVNFDFDKYPEILEALHNCVRENIPADEVKYCEDGWKDGDVGILCYSISWDPVKLRDVQDFLDKINEILKPIMNECEGDGLEFSSKWYIQEANMAVAWWHWTDEGFKIIGVEL